MTNAQRVKLWDEIARYVVACGGDPSKHVYGNTLRMTAVAQVETIIREVEAEWSNSLRRAVEADGPATRSEPMTATRSDRCTACGRPTYVGEDFGGPCVHDTDLACAMAQRDDARAQLDAVRVELLKVQHAIGEAWFAGGVDTPAALRRKTVALERLGTQPMKGAKLVSHLLRRIGHLRDALKAAASSIEVVAEGRVDAEALPHQQDMREVRAYSASLARDARKALMEDDTDAMPDAVRAERMKLSGWIKCGGPCVEGDTIYGPHQDACDMIAAAIERGEP